MTPPPNLAFHVSQQDIDHDVLLGGGCLKDNSSCTSDIWHHCPEVHKAIDGVRFIADHTRREEESTKVTHRRRSYVQVFNCELMTCTISSMFYTNAVRTKFCFSRLKKTGNTWQWF